MKENTKKNEDKRVAEAVKKRPKTLKATVKRERSLSRSNSCRSVSSHRSGGFVPDEKMLTKKQLDGEELYKLFRGETQKNQRRKDTLKKNKAKEKKRDPYKRPNRANADLGSTSSLSTSSLSDLTSSDDAGSTNSKDSKFRKSISRLSRKNSMRSFLDGEEEEETDEEIVKEDFYSIGKRIFDEVEKSPTTCHMGDYYHNIKKIVDKMSYQKITRMKKQQARKARREEKLGLTSTAFKGFGPNIDM